MALLSRDAILSADDYEYETVSCPEWGGDVRVRSMTAAERDEYEASLIKTKGNKRTADLRNARAKLVAACAVDEAGNHVFKPSDVHALGRKNARPVDRLTDAIARLSGTSEDDEDDAVEDFESAQGDN